MSTPCPPDGGAELYVYYRLRREDAEAAAAAFAQACGGEPVRLLQRSDADAKGLLTWMEIYAPAQAADALLRQRIATRLAPWLQSPRHEERFIALAIRTSQG